METGSTLRKVLLVLVGVAYGLGVAWLIFMAAARVSVILGDRYHWTEDYVGWEIIGNFIDVALCILPVCIAVFGFYLPYASQRLGWRKAAFRSFVGLLVAGAALVFLFAFWGSHGNGVTDAEALAEAARISAEVALAVALVGGPAVARRWPSCPCSHRACNRPDLRCRPVVTHPGAPGANLEGPAA